MRILLTGGSGFLGQSVFKHLLSCGYSEKDIFIPRSHNYDLTNYETTRRLFESVRPQAVIHLAATVGGIGANKQNPGLYFYNNMVMGINVIEHSRLFDVEKFVQIGTVCSYPKFTPVPFNEDSLWNGYPEETNAPYGIAKKSLYVMLKAYYDQYNFKSIVLMPCNLYGPNDNFKPESSHVIPALIKKFVGAVDNNDNEVVCWGDGSATREFLYVDDAARGIVLGLDKCDDAKIVNLGSGNEISIKLLSETIAELCGYKGRIIWDSSMPNGQPRRFLSTARAYEILGWKANMDFITGLNNTIVWYKNNLI